MHDIALIAELDKSDRELLRRFTTYGDQGAFAALVRRYGPLVMGACRRHIGHYHEAEDACQAVFLVLARKAGAVDWRDSVGGWLHEVASRVAADKRSRLSRCRTREIQGIPLFEFASPRDAMWREEFVELERELSRLPEKYRAPLMLCYLEGRTRDEAARKLGVSPGRIKGLLERGRRFLRRRLRTKKVSNGTL